MRLIYKNKGYQLEIYVDQDRELWICELNGKRKAEFDHLETMLKYLVDYYSIRNSKFVKELSNLAVELGEIYNLIYQLGKSNFIGWRE